MARGHGLIVRRRRGAAGRVAAGEKAGEQVREHGAHRGQTGADDAGVDFDDGADGGDERTSAEIEGSRASFERRHSRD